jgi:hypothetical protein
VTVGDFHAVDKNQRCRFPEVEVAPPGQARPASAPDSLSIGEVALADFFARVIISREGKLNLLQIVRQSEAPPVAPAGGCRGGKAVAPVAATGKPPLPVASANHAAGWRRQLQRQFHQAELLGESEEDRWHDQRPVVGG